jgi:hypothetical protein
MTLIQMVVILAVLFVVALVAYFLITTFFKSQPAQNIALIVVGIILLCILLSQFFPGLAGYHVWR